MLKTLLTVFVLGCVALIIFGIRRVCRAARETDGFSSWVYGSRKFSDKDS